MAYTVGSAFYGIYFIVSYPLFYRQVASSNPISVGVSIELLRFFNGTWLSDLMSGPSQGCVPLFGMQF
jgi:hypothetical protein